MSEKDNFIMVQALYYKTIIFDYGGVLLRSNEIKGDAFRKCAEPFGKEVADLFYDFHLRNNGLSRHRKFEYLFERILQIDFTENDVFQLANKFANLVEQSLLICEINPALFKLRKASPNTIWMVISAGEQEQLRRIFAARGLAHLFPAGVYGGPKLKKDIYRELNDAEPFQDPVLYIGDSVLDCYFAKEVGIDFVFDSEWSICSEWANFKTQNPEVTSVRNLGELML